MRNLYIRWILPVIALLVIATALVMGNIAGAGAASVKHHKTTTITSVTQTPTLHNAYYAGP